jgi:hypothetical protein
MAMLRNVPLERLRSGDPKYRLEVHASDSEDAPVLACGTQHTVWVVDDESLRCPRCDSHRFVQVKE